MWVWARLLAIPAKENGMDWENIQSTNGRMQLRSGMAEEGEFEVYMQTSATKTYTSFVKRSVTQ